MKNNEYPFVSILMPTYNCAEFIVEAIESVISQELLNWELLILDDGSTDNTKLLVENYIKSDSRIKYFFEENNKGVSFQLNKGTQISLGKYICRIDADDYFHKDKLLIQFNFLEKHSETMLCTTNYTEINNNTGEKKIIKGPTCYNQIKIELIKDLIVCGASFFCRKEIFKEFSFNENIVIGEDYDFISKIALEYKIDNISENLYFYRKHGNSLVDNRANWDDSIIEQIQLYYVENILTDLNKCERYFLCRFSKNKIEKIDFGFYKTLYSVIKKINANVRFQKEDIDVFFESNLKDNLKNNPKHKISSMLGLFFYFPEFSLRLNLLIHLKILKRSIFNFQF
jgi:glycosyltransferase involved in cell wall biosynthesis